MTSNPSWFQEQGIETHIRIKARMLVKRGGINERDREDFEQDCRLHLIEVAPKYDPSRGKPGTFASAVIDNFVLRYLRGNRALKRKPNRRLYFQSEWQMDPKTSCKVPVELLMNQQASKRPLGIEQADHITAIERRDLAEYIRQQVPEYDIELMLRVNRSGVKKTAEWRGDLPPYSVPLPMLGQRPSFVPSEGCGA